MFTELTKKEKLAFKKEVTEIKKTLEKTGLSEKEADDSIESLKDMFDRNNPYATYMLADLYAAGKHVDKDVKLAYHLFNESYFQGNVEAAFKLAFECKLEKYPEDAPSGPRLMEWAMARDKDYTLRRLKEMAEEGNGEAMYYLGTLDGMYGEHLGEWFQKAIDAGYPEALFIEASELIDEGEDIDRAMEMLERSAEEYPDSAFLLGELYFCSDIVEPDHSKSERYFRMAVKEIEPAKMFIDYICGKSDATVPNEMPEWFILESMTAGEGMWSILLDYHGNEHGGYENDTFSTIPFDLGISMMELGDMSMIGKFIHKSTGFMMKWHKIPLNEFKYVPELKPEEYRRILRECVESIMQDMKELRETE